MKLERDRLEVRRRLLARNDEIASRNRERLRAAGVWAANLASSPGAGKTRLISETAAALKDRVRMAAIVGDVETDRDARRLRKAGIPTVQIQTHGACHLDAEWIDRVLHDSLSTRPALLFIENVGNLVCPANYDLGESAKVALLSVTEGDDKPEKYPALFRAADVVLLTKVDLLPHVEFSMDAFQARLQALNPDVPLHLVSATQGDGMEGWLKFLEERIGAMAAHGREAGTSV